MSLQLKTSIERLKTNLLRLASLTLEQLDKAHLALRERDVKLALEVVEADNLLDHQEVDLEEECLKILALYQPVAFDLRFVIAVLKMNNDLERIGDLASGIAARVQTLVSQNTPDLYLDFSPMFQNCREMLEKCLDALIKLDSKAAIEVCEQDIKIDSIHRANIQHILRMIFEHPDYAQSIISYLSISRNLERVADQTTNIAEDIVYLVDGKIIRHTGL